MQIIGLGLNLFISAVMVTKRAENTTITRFWTDLGTTTSTDMKNQSKILGNI